MPTWWLCLSIFRGVRLPIIWAIAKKYSTHIAATAARNTATNAEETNKQKVEKFKLIVCSGRWRAVSWVWCAISKMRVTNSWAMHHSLELFRTEKIYIKKSNDGIKLLFKRFWPRYTINRVYLAYLARMFFSSILINFLTGQRARMFSFRLTGTVCDSVCHVRPDQCRKTHHHLLVKKPFAQHVFNSVSGWHKHGSANVETLLHFRSKTRAHFAWKSAK